MHSRPRSAHLRTHPFAQSLRRAIDLRGMTLTALHEALSRRGWYVSVSTLSSWRSGARHPEGERSRRIVVEIEGILGTPSGALTGRIGPSRRTGRIGSPTFPWNDDDLWEAVVDTHSALGIEFPPPVRDLSMSSVTDVRADGAMASRRTLNLVQSTTGDVSALPLVEIMPWVPIPAPSFTVLGGGVLTETASHPSGRVHGARIELHEPLAPGATALLETVVEFSPHGPRVYETGMGSGRAVRELVLWVRFPAAARPDWCNVVEELPERRPAVTPLMLDRSGSGHVVRRGFGPGAVGVHWGYEDRGSPADFPR